MWRNRKGKRTQTPFLHVSVIQCTVFNRSYFSSIPNTPLYKTVRFRISRKVCKCIETILQKCHEQKCIPLQHIYYSFFLYFLQKRFEVESLSSKDFIGTKHRWRIFYFIFIRQKKNCNVNLKREERYYFHRNTALNVSKCTGFTLINMANKAFFDPLIMIWKFPSSATGEEWANNHA